MALLWDIFRARVNNQKRPLDALRSQRGCWLESIFKKCVYFAQNMELAVANTLVSMMKLWLATKNALTKTIQCHIIIYG